MWALPGMVPLIVVALTGFSGYSGLLPVAPLWVVRGGADAGGAGLVNFVLLSSTVATQFFVPHVIRTIGWGHALAVGMVLLGVPALAHGVTPHLAWVLSLAGIRGVGFGLLTVAASAAAVLVADPGRRGAAIGAFSLAISVPMVLLMPTGAWISEAWGFWPIFAASAVPLLGIPSCYALSATLPARSTHDPAHPAPDAAGAPPLGHTLRALISPTVVLLAITLAAGAVITFAPQVATPGWVAASGLFALGLVGALTRWAVGILADRLGAARLMWPFVLVSVAGLAWLAYRAAVGVTDADIAAWLTACALVGLGYGGLQNLTMVRAFEAAGPRAIGIASAVWNAGFDAGTALGSAVVGAIAVGSGFGPGFALTAALCLLTLPLALRVAARRPRA